MGRGTRRPLVAREVSLVTWALNLDDAGEEGSARIAVARNLLKSELMYARGELTITGWLPVCPICSEPVQTPDMHEAILSRGDVQGLHLAHQMKIFARENCVLVHPGKCHIEAAAKEGTRQCVLQLLEKEGSMAILQWLTHMGILLPQELLNKAINLVQLVDEQSLIRAMENEVSMPVRSSSPMIGDVSSWPNPDPPKTTKGEIASQPRRGVIHP